MPMIQEEIFRLVDGCQQKFASRISSSLRAGLSLSHACERRAKQSGGKESGEEALGESLTRLAASPLDFVLTATPRASVLQREPARRLNVIGKNRVVINL